MKTAVLAFVALITITGVFALTYGPFPQSAAQDPKFHNELGYHFAQQGELQAAQDAFAQAVALDPEYENARKNLAVAAFKNSDYLTAITHGRILAQTYGKKQYHFDLGQALVAKARFDESDPTLVLEYLEEALSHLQAAGEYPHAEQNAKIVENVLQSAAQS